MFTYQHLTIILIKVYTVDDNTQCANGQNSCVAVL